MKNNMQISGNQRLSQTLWPGRGGVASARVSGSKRTTARAIKRTSKADAVPYRNNEVRCALCANAIRKGELTAPIPQTAFIQLSAEALPCGLTSAVLRLPAGVVIPWPTPKTQTAIMPSSQGPEVSRVIPKAISTTPTMRVKR